MAKQPNLCCYGLLRGRIYASRAGRRGGNNLSEVHGSALAARRTVGAGAGLLSGPLLVALALPSRCYWLYDECVHIRQHILLTVRHSFTNVDSAKRQSEHSVRACERHIDSLNCQRALILFHQSFHISVSYKASVRHPWLRLTQLYQRKILNSLPPSFESLH